MVSERTDAVAALHVQRWLDALVYSSVLAAAVAGALTTAASLALAIPVEPALVCLVVAGTLVVYNVDRLRDLERDRALAPLRSAFVDHNQKRLGALVLLAAALSTVCALQLTRTAWLLCGVVLALGLFHRRLKRIRGIKTLYLTGSWLAVVLGLPLACADPGSWPAGDRLYWVWISIGCAVASNLVASNLDRRRATEDQRHTASRTRLGVAIVVAGLGVGSALVGPQALRALALIPGCELLILSRFHAAERYSLMAIDGALFAGACGAMLLLRWA